MHNQVSPSTATSPQTKSQPTPLAIREAFVDAIEAFADWTLDQPQPTLPFGNDDITLSRACQAVLNCQSPIPKSCRETLAYCDVAPKDNTYAAAARAMLEAIKVRIRSQAVGADH
jgi:hypothetical protein